MEQVTQGKKWLYSGAIALGVAVGAAGIASAATGSSTTTVKPATGTVIATHGNEDTAHEKGETAAREADEKAGKVGHRGDGKGHGNEVALTGSSADKAKAAALVAVPGATVERVENDSDGATYEAHVVKADGTEVTVKMDASFKVTSIDTHGMGDHGHGHGHDHGANGNDNDGSKIG